MATPPNSPPPPPPPPSPPTGATSQSSSTLKWTRKATRLTSLATRSAGIERPLIHVDPETGKVNGPHKKKLRTYLGIIAHDKVDVTYKNWKQAEFDIPEASDFKSDLTSKWALVADKDSVDDTVIQKQNTAPHVLSRGGYEYFEKKLMDKKTKKKLEEAGQSGSTNTMIDPPSPIKRHVKRKMARTKKTDQMTFEAAKEIANKIGSFVAHGQHPGCVRAAGAGAMIKQYFGPAPRTSRMFSSMALEDLEQLTQQIRDQLEESIIEKSQFQSHMQSQRLALPPEPEIGPSAARVSIKESCVDPSGNDPNTSDSNKCGLYIEENPPCLVALGKIYEGSTTIHNIPLLHDQVKVGVEEVRDANTLIPVPTKDVKLVGQTLNTFLAWLTHLVKRLSEQGAMGPAKPVDMPNCKVDDPLYLMTLTIPQLFLKPLQVMWDAIVFEVFNEDFPLYIKHEDLSKIAHDGQFLSISVIQLWILALKGLDDTLQPKSKVGARWIVVKCNKQKGSTECGYYGMHWMSTIILGSFKNNWETDVRKKARAIQKQNSAPHVLSRGGYEFLENKLMDEKKKKQLEEAAKFGSTDTVIDPPSPIKRHVKKKMARTKKTGQMTSEEAKKIANKITIGTREIEDSSHLVDKLLFES
ncbi:hypothetical protein HKD37_17G048111 [Glycine soja]